MLQTDLLQVQRGKYVIEAEISRLRGPSTCSPGRRKSSIESLLKGAAQA
jgi:hypothetical protein